MPRIVGLTCAAAALSAGLALALGAAHAEDTAKTKFGAWELQCQTPAGSKTEQCALTQTIRSEDKADSSLGVIVVKPAEIKTTVLRVVAPLNVYLLNGVSLKIDQTDIGRVPFFRCSPGGCLADAPLDDQQLNQLRNGKLATLVIYLDPSEGLRHQVRLEGFKQGYEKLR
ncbi:MAG: invasion associated locus B family protein [Methylocystis sp.]|uniref:invasion associated locus B family protein n=1 Tax=Methylocystis sp. TaxID=1911079 RepID=UPI003DA52B73